MEEPGDSFSPELNGHGAGDHSEDEGCNSITKVSVRKRSSRHSVTFDVVEHVMTAEENSLLTSGVDAELDGSDFHSKENLTSDVAETYVTSDRRGSTTSMVSRQSQTSDGDVENKNMTSNGDQHTSSEVINHAETAETNGTSTPENHEHPAAPNGEPRQTLVNGNDAPETKSPLLAMASSSRQSTVSQASKRYATSSGSKLSVKFDTSRTDVMTSTPNSRLWAAGKTRGLDGATLRRISRKLPVVSDTLPPQSFLTMAALPSRPALSSNTKIAGRLFNKGALDAEQWTRYTDRSIMSPSNPPRRHSRGSLTPIKAPLELVPDKDLGPRIHTLEPRPQSYHHHPRRPRMRPLAQPALAHAPTDVYSFSFKHNDGVSVSGSDNCCDPDSELRSDFYSAKRVTRRSRATTCPMDRSRTSMLLLGRQKCLHGRDAFADGTSPDDMVSQVSGVQGVSAAKL